MQWREIIVHTTTDGADLLSELMMELGAAGTEIVDRADVPDPDKPGVYWELYDKKLLEEMPEDVLVKGWFARDEQEQQTVENLKARLEALKADSFGVEMGSLRMDEENVKDEDWAEEWKKNYKPFRIGSHLVVKPTWEKYVSQPGDLVIELDPGMAFGTGAHHTTRMCLELLEKTVRPGDTMLDMGCGSGILSIASLLLGAKKAVAVDIDPIAETIARENAAMNGLGEQDYEIRIGNLISDKALQTDIRGQYPVVAANIVADVILALCPFAREVVAPGGTFIVSGIIDDREAEVEAGLKQAGFAVKEVLSSDCWFAILCENPQ